MMTFEEYARYYEDAVLSMGKTSSIKSTKSRLRKIISRIGDQELPLTPRTVQLFITYLSKTYPPQTVTNLWGALRSVLVRAKADGIITEIPSPRLPKIEKTEQDWFRPEEMRSLAKYDLLYTVAAETGARIGELLALKYGDLDLKENTLAIKRNVYDGVFSTPKTRAGTRQLSLSKRLGKLLQAEGFTDKEAFIFAANNGAIRSVDAELARLHHACKVFGVKPQGFHSFRRGNATLQASIIGVPEKIIAYRLGHGNLGLTLGRYAKYLVGMDREAAEQISELLK
jgi:integrase